MLGILLIYFIGKRFYDLAATYRKHQWGFAIAGVAAYYGGTFIAGFLIAIYYELVRSTPIEEMSDLTLSLLALPFGILACIGLYKLLEYRWKHQPQMTSPDLLDDEFIQG